MISFTIETKYIIPWNTFFSKDVKDHYGEIYITLLTDILKDVNNLRGNPCSWTERLSITKISVFSNFIPCNFNQNSIRVSYEIW